ncbi:MAG: LysR substrate-binding domain-containing protein, partial [Pseudonocardia sp.]|nr:LysR substrate-binding domain-containing protein [Pseudonocardia sp.]
IMGSHGATVAAARAGLGATLVSRDGVRPLLAGGALVELPVPGTPLPRPWHVVTHPDATASTELLIRHLLADDTLGWRAPPGSGSGSGSGPPGSGPGPDDAGGRLDDRGADHG